MVSLSELFGLSDTLQGKVKLRDKRRNFTKLQQSAILYQQDYRCAGEWCNHADLDLRITEYHHSEPWGQYGRTIIKNGIALCPNCHRLIHRTERLAKQEGYVVKKPDCKFLESIIYCC